jgi:hypothetical protein
LVARVEGLADLKASWLAERAAILKLLLEAVLRALAVACRM